MLKIVLSLLALFLRSIHVCVAVVSPLCDYSIIYLSVFLL